MGDITREIIEKKDKRQRIKWGMRVEGSLYTCRVDIEDFSGKQSSNTSDAASGGLCNDSTNKLPACQRMPIATANSIK